NAATLPLIQGESRRSRQGVAHKDFSCKAGGQLGSPCPMARILPVFRLMKANSTVSREAEPLTIQTEKRCSTLNGLWLSTAAGSKCSNQADSATCCAVSSSGTATVGG